MKLFGKTKDGVFDDLLRAYVSRPKGVRPACSDFDPDLANAYVERGLSGILRSRYEEHLAECAPCRKSVVVLSRLAAVEASPTASGTHPEARPGLLFAVRQWLGALSAPQWGMVAVVALAISLPLMLSRNEMRQGNRVATAAAEQPPNDKAQDAPAAFIAGSKSDDGTPLSPKSETSIPKSRAKRENDTGLPNGTLAANTQEAAEKRLATEESKTETKSGSQVTDEIQKKSENQVAAQVPAQSGTAGQQTRSDSDNARQQPSGKDGAQSGESGKRADEQAAQKENVARAEAIAPPSPSVEPGRSRGGVRRAPAKLALRESETGDAVRPAEKKIYGKSFTLKEGTWTDKDFDPEKDLPVVTLVRDSNVYKEVLNKRAKLKPYLSGFSSTERAIIVYKGTVYKLIPQ